MIDDDKEYVIKELGISKQEFEEIMNYPVKSILDNPNNYTLDMKFIKLLNKLKKLNILPN